MPTTKHENPHWPQDGRCRVVIESVTPQVDAGAFPVKRTVGESVVVEADAFTDGHDAVACVLRYRRDPDGDWQEAVMQALGNDRWRAAFAVTQMGYYRYSVSAWIDRFESWRRDLRKRIDVSQDSDLHYRVGAGLIAPLAERATGTDAEQLRTAARPYGSRV